jgi:entericidin A
MKLMLAIFAVAFLAGCNTMEGVGRDIGKAGEKIEEAAKKK